MDYATIVDDAVRQFYSAGSNETHSWLLRAQASPEAWHFVWQLLDPSKVPVSARISLTVFLSLYFITSDLSSCYMSFSCDLLQRFLT